MSIPENMNVEVARIARPALIGTAGPSLSASRPATGATTAITIVVGRNLIPAWSAP